MMLAELVAAVCAILDGTSQARYAFFFFLRGRYRPFRICAASKEANELMSHSKSLKTVQWYLGNPEWIANVQSGAY